MVRSHYKILYPKNTKLVTIVIGHKALKTLCPKGRGQVDASRLVHLNYTSHLAIQKVISLHTMMSCLGLPAVQ